MIHWKVWKKEGVKGVREGAGSGGRAKLRLTELLDQSKLAALENPYCELTMMILL